MFTVNDVVNAPSKEIFGSLLDYAKSKGVPVFEGTNINSWHEYNNIIFTTSKALCGTTNSLGFKEITIDEFIKKCNTHISNSFQITDDHEAKLTKEGIKVGCQLITYEKFDKLVELVKRYRK